MNSLRYLLRRMLRSAGFSAIVTSTIALAVGINLGIFCITQSILNHSLGVPKADKIVYYTLGSQEHKFIFSGPSFEALRAHAAMKDILAWKKGLFRLKTQDGAVKVSGALVTGNTFSVFRLTPSLGRFFSDSDDAPGGGKDGWAAVIGYSYWKTHFRANPNVIGQNITVEGAPVHIVGVLPQEFTGVSPLSPADILLPRHFLAISSPGEDRFANPGDFEWMVFGRLPQGVSIQTVQANLDAIEPSFLRSADPKSEIFTSDLFPDTAPGSFLHVQNGRLGASFSTTALHIPLHAMQVLAVFVFLFCCCNLALLFVGRAKREAQSVAIRIALGARLGNEMRYAMLEATALSAIGCLIAVPIAWSTALILSLVIQSIRGFNSFPTTSPSATLLLAASGATLTIACMVGAGSSFWYGRKPASISLKGRHGASVARSKSWIIGFEVFATMLLATIAVVDVVGFQKQANQPAGFTTSSTILASLDLTGNSSNNETIMNKENRILDRIEGSPGVQAVAEINVPPISGSEASGILTARGKDGAMQKQKIWPADVSVSYFSAIGTRIVRGRDFAMDDLAGNPVCILSSRASSAFFSGEDPLGKFLYQGGDTTNNEALALYCRVVGIAEDAHFESMSDPADSVVYRLTKEEMSNIIVKAATNELAIQAVRNAVRMVDQEGMAPRIDTIQAHIEDDLRIWRVITLSGTLCACISAVILGIGFFGILALQVAERRREIGIQIALGANRTQVCISVMKTLRHAVLAGLVLGSATALLAANALAQFYNLSARFVIGGYLGSLVLLGVLLFAAAAVPLRRALAVSPMECLASE